MRAEEAERITETRWRHISGISVTAYPNVIEFWVDGRRYAFTPEDWARLVEFVGIRGLAEEPA